MTILDDALALTSDSGDRRVQYGSPYQEAEAITGAEKALGLQQIPEHFHMRMVLFKIYREAKRHKRDNLIDICGYTRCAEDYWLEHDEVEDARKSIAESGPAVD